MNNKLSLSILVICANLIGVTSAIAPASALNMELKKELKEPVAEIGKLKEQSKEPVAEIGKLKEQSKEPVAETLKPKEELKELVAEIAKLTEQPKEPVAEIAKLTEQPKEPVAEIAKLTEQLKESVAEIAKPETPSESDVKAQVKSDVDVLQGTLKSETEHVDNLEIKEGVNNTLEGTTDTKVLDKVGATSDKTIHTAVIDPTKESPSLNPLIEKTGNGTTLDITHDSSGINIHVDSDEHIKVGNVAKVDICLDANAKVGGSADPSLANCAKKSQTVPEPTTIGGLFLMGGYLISRRRKVLSHKRAKLFS
ncbi:PEP-CTERM sorting domain-containing protein [Scytonema sp. NUACC26]|uniref:PEP-CTERM sorting domain-containing protein n=1 Tax=Scytonema sp. NUACC26 TaxID=3140176 RepID=UPI0034DC95CB